MYKDPEPELIAQADDTVEEYSIETPEIEITPSLNERLILWLETIDR